MNSLNKYFKDVVIHDLWDTEKFSLKEAQNEPDVEKYALQLWDVTHGILALENQIIGNITKNWREMKTFYDNIVYLLDGDQTNNEERPNTASIEGREQMMQFFMINKICVEITPNAFEQMMNGVYQVRYAALNYIAKITSSIASTVKRNQYVAQMRQCLLFENTKSSK